MKLLADHRTFESTELLNEAVRQHIYAHKFELNATAITALETISRYAVKYAGAAWLKIGTLAGLLDKSPATTRRALASLERAGIIERVSFMRRITGGNGGNIIRILPAKVSDDCPQMIARANRVEPTAASVEEAKSASEALYSLNKPIQTFNPTLQAADKAPATFYEHIQSLISDKKQRREFFTAYKKQVASLLRFDIHADKGEMLNTYAIQALYIAMKRQQSGSVDNPVGYFFGVLKNKIDQALFDDIHEVYAADPDLLASLPY